MSESKFSCPHLTVVQWNADVPGVYYKPVLLAPLNLKLGDNSDALPLANSIALACNAHEQLVAALQEAKEALKHSRAIIETPESKERHTDARKTVALALVAAGAT